MLSLGFCLSAKASEVLPPEEQKTSSYSYETAEVQRKDISVRSPISRMRFLQQDRRILYHGPEMEVVEICVSRLQEVKAGDVLVRLYPKQDDIETAEKQRALQRNEEDFERKKRDYESQIAAAEKTLSEMTDAESRSIQELRIQKLRIEYERCVFETEHQITADRAALEKLGTTVEICAPMDGTVNRILDKSETSVSDGDFIAQILSKRRQTVLIEQSDILKIGRVHYGAAVFLPPGSEGIGSETTGTVIASSKIPEMSEKDLLEGWSVVTLNDPSAELQEKIDEGKLPGRLFEDCTYEERLIKNALSVPAAALKSEERADGTVRYYVDVMSDEGLLNRRNVQIYDPSTEDIWILSGLSEGETVVVRERSN